MSDLSAQEVNQVIEIMINHLQKLGALPALSKELKEQLVQTVASSLQQNQIELTNQTLTDPKALNKLSNSIVTAFVSPPGEGMHKTIGLIMQKELSPEESKQLNTAFSYIEAMQNKPGLKLNLDLVFKDTKEMSADEKQQFVLDLEKVLNELNDMEKNPEMKLSPDQIQKLIDTIKEELAQDEPGMVSSSLNNSDDVGFENASMNLFGIDVTTPGKIAGPVPTFAGNLFGVADMFPAMSDGAAIHRASGDILGSSQAATGVQATAADRAISIVEDLADAFKDAGIEPEAAYKSPSPLHTRPTHGGIS